MSDVFKSKLDRLNETIRLAAEVDHRPLSVAMEACASVPVLAVGSGGSAIAAEFLAACRTGLGHWTTTVVTPMAFVLDAAGAPGTHAWLFSASGENPDILAAFNAACAEHGSQVDILTSGHDGSLAVRAIEQSRHELGARLHLAPVADAKDGFLATHSAVSAAVVMTMAADLVAAGSPNRNERRKQLLEDADRLLGSSFRQRLRTTTIAPLRGRDTVFLLHDPHLTAAAVMVETSFWEAGICAVQRADFRNFAHGRHVWMARHPDRTFVIALTCERSRNAWRGIREELPDSIPAAEFDYGRSGRGGLFEAILSMLGVIEAAGSLKGVDPGRPGVTDFGRRIFDRQDLRDAMSGDDASILRKRRARGRTDPTVRTVTNWAECRKMFAAALAKAEIRAVVLDYDGTVVPTQRRLEPPRSQIIESLTAFADHGIQVGFATGRGGSVGTMLRRQMPERLHASVMIGYYNGAHVVPLSVDIEKSPPAADEVIAKVHSLLCAESGLFTEGWWPKAGRLQLSIPFEKLASRYLGINRIEEIVENCGEAASQQGSVAGVSPQVNPAAAWLGKAKVVRSGHSIDVFPGWAGKGKVIEAVRERLGKSDAHVLRVGDRGEHQGNDYELLADGLGLSVDQVCESEDFCWNLLPAEISGPDGLAKILRSLKPSANGTLKFDVSVLFTV